MRKLEEELSDEEGLSKLLQTLEQEREQKTSLEMVKKELQREVDREIISQKQADSLMKKITTETIDEEFSLLQLQSEKEKQEADLINEIQEEIALAVKRNIFSATQADEMLMNLENGVWNLDEGGMLFDLTHELKR